jgi:hypothetical protein
MKKVKKGVIIKHTNYGIKNHVERRKKSSNIKSGSYKIGLIVEQLQRNEKNSNESQKLIKKTFPSQSLTNTIDEPFQNENATIGNLIFYFLLEKDKFLNI